MKVQPFFVVFPVLIGAVLYAYYAPKDKPEGDITLTPKQYIELVEKKKLEKKQAIKKQAADEANAKNKPDN